MHDGGERAKRCVFAGVFEGDRGKCGVFLWCFCGEVVVFCVVNVVVWLSVFRREKNMPTFQNYFLWISSRVRAAADCMSPA
jgi:hypothetical protein